jgi:dTDP-4-dehydrorhamnose reductase
MHYQFGNNSRILITGVTSIHGWPIYRKLQSILPAGRLFGIRPPGVTIPDEVNVASLCMTDRPGFERFKNEFNPTHILHAAGVCDLDACEAKPDFAHNINVNGARAIVSVFSESCYIMYLSADLVYSGNNESACGYSETDAPDPVSVVGKTYMLAEREILKARRRAVVRIGLPMGGSIQGTKGAIDFIEGRLKRGLPMSLFHDEYRSCIPCEDLANAVVEMFAIQVEGVFHVGGPRAVSLYEIGERILERGNYRREALLKWSRRDDVNGPPRIGNVHLNSAKAEQLLGRAFRAWEY